MTSAINTAADLFNVKGMVAVITGGGTGLGMYAARALDANGAKAVYIVGRREQPLRDVAASGRNGTIKPIVGDISNKESLVKIAAQVKEEQGFINLLFANAGIIGPKFSQALSKKGDGPPTVSEYAAALLKPEMEEFSSTFHTNVTAVVYTVASFLELLEAGNKQGNLAQDSQVLVTSSIAGFSRQTAAGLSYSTSKAGATHLVKMLSTAWAQNKYRIRANVVAPGFYPSEMTEDTTKTLDRFGGVKGHEGVFAGAHTMGIDKTPAARTGSEQDFAGAFLYLVSQAGAFVNGETLVTDGGRLAQLPAVY